ncbi:MAG: hypothetical protein H0W08_11575 [Acidobacteria bacterium]|nr:hypothetical protein [Acidobacteriota bacterium]
MAKDTDLDALFALPLDEFTAARNALAKNAGKDGAAIKALSKPPLAAWAVNQLYRQDRDHYDALIDAANEMRRTHKAVIEGKRADLRSAGREHELALEAGLKATIGLMKQSGNPVTNAVRQAILNTLRALPADEAPGRLTRALAPGGFEMLAGISPAAAPKRTARTSQDAGTPGPDQKIAPAAKDGRKKADAKAERDAAQAREQRTAERAVRDADQRARRAEFEAARAARDATRTARRLDEVRKAVADAQAELDTAEREDAEAQRTSEAAERRSRDAQAALDTTKSKLLP